jgi:hypothetical protein
MRPFYKNIIGGIYNFSIARSNSANPATGNRVLKGVNLGDDKKGGHTLSFNNFFNSDEHGKKCITIDGRQIPVNDAGQDINGYVFEHNSKTFSIEADNQKSNWIVSELTTNIKSAPSAVIPQTTGAGNNPFVIKPDVVQTRLSKVVVNNPVGENNEAPPPEAEIEAIQLTETDGPVEDIGEVSVPVLDVELETEATQARYTEEAEREVAPLELESETATSDAENVEASELPGEPADGPDPTPVEELVQNIKAGDDVFQSEEEILEESGEELKDIEADTREETTITREVEDMETWGLPDVPEENDTGDDVVTIDQVIEVMPQDSYSNELAEVDDSDTQNPAENPSSAVPLAQQPEAPAAQAAQNPTMNTSPAWHVAIAGGFGGQPGEQTNTSAARKYNPYKRSIGRDIVDSIRADPDNSYKTFTSAINQYKNDPETLDNIVSAVSAALNEALRHYDIDVYRNKYIATDEIAPSSQEVFELWFSTENKISNTICGTIHGTVMQALNECGIEAAVVNTLYTNANAMHYTLIYKIGEGQYIFNNYGNSVSIEAPNVLEAIKSVLKANPIDNHSDGFVSICNTQGNLTEYALMDVAVFGLEVDKYSDIMKDLSAEKQRRARGLYISTNGNITQEEFAAQVGYAWTAENGDLSLDVGVKNNGESNVADESQSFGLKLTTFNQYEKSWGSWGFESTTLGSITNLTTGGNNNPYNHNIITIAFSGRIFSDIDLFYNAAGSLTLRPQIESNIAIGAAPSNSKKKAGINGVMGDAGFNLGGGLNYTNTFGELTFGAHASARGLFNYSRTFVNASIWDGILNLFTLNLWRLQDANNGYQVAGGLSIGSGNQQGFVWDFRTDTAYMQDANQSRFSASGNLNLGYLNHRGTSINGTLGAEYSKRNIFGMFNETINQGLVLNIGFDVTLKNQMTLFANASQELNFLANQASKFSPEVTLGLGFSW